MTILTSIIEEHIQTHGPVGFDWFMNQCLYHPELGYYEKLISSPVGKEGDFITSVSVGKTFGKLIALWILNRIDESTSEEPHYVVEAGAHHGQLAQDIVESLNDLNRLDAIESYIIVEPSQRRQKIQEQILEKSLGKIHHISDVQSLTCSENILFISNELFDAFPCKRIFWNKPKHCWSEWKVKINQNQFEWYQDREENIFNNLAKILRERLKLPEDVNQVLPDGFTLEISESMIQYYESLMNQINSGHILTIDYGALGEEWISPHRLQGSLRGYHKHQLTDKVLEKPGELDLTYNVCFQDLETIGSQHGWRSQARESQHRFLSRLIQNNLSLIENNKDFWTMKDMRQLQTLISPQHFGNQFKILWQNLAS